jgi:lipopolysaccharide export system permease protein
VRILDRLVAGTFLRLFALSVLATPPLLILGDLTEKLDDYLDASLGGLTIAQGYLFKLPMFFTWAFPIAGLIAGVFTVHGMTTHREVIAAKAGGVSFYRLFAPVMVLGVVLSGLALAVADLVPRSNRRAAELLAERRAEREWKSDFAFQAENGYTMAVGRLTLSDRRMAQITLTREMDDGSQLHISADGAAWEDGRWVFRDGTYRHIPGPGVEYATRFEHMVIRDLHESPEDLIQESGEPEEMTRQEVLRRARITESAGGDASKLFLELHRRFAIPVATAVIILFGIPLATSSKRGGTAYGIGVALASTILYLFLVKVFGGLGEAGTIPVDWAAWTPNGIFLVTASILLARVRT